MQGSKAAKVQELHGVEELKTKRLVMNGKRKV